MNDLYRDWKNSFCPSCPVPIPDEEKKWTWIFFFKPLCCVSNGFMKALKAFIKPFEAPQRSVKIKTSANFYFHKTFWDAQGRKSYPFRHQPLKIVKHTQIICRQKPTNCLSVFAHFVGLTLKGLKLGTFYKDSGLENHESAKTGKTQSLLNHSYYFWNTCQQLLLKGFHNQNFCKYFKKLWNRKTKQDWIKTHF